MKAFHITLYIVIYALADLWPFRLAGRTGEERWTRFWDASKRWLTTLLNIFSLATLIVSAVVTGGLVIGTTQLIRQYIEKNPLALVVEVHGGIGASVKTISESEEAEICTLARTGKTIRPMPGCPEADRLVHHVAGWNDYDLWFWKKDGGQDTDFTPGRTVQKSDPLLQKLKFLVRPPPGGLFLRENDPQLIVTGRLLEQLGYPFDPRRPDPNSVPETLYVTYKGKAAPLRIAGVAEWTPSGDFLIPEKFYRRFRDKQWNWPALHPHAYLGPVNPAQADDVLAKAAAYLKDQNVDASLLERTGQHKWLHFRLPAGRTWTEEYWRKTFFPTTGEYLQKPAWYAELAVEFDSPRSADEDAWSTIDIGYTRASVYVRDLESVPDVVDTLRRRGLGVDDHIAREVTFLRQVSAFGKRLFAWVIGAVALMAAVNIGLSFAQTIQRKQAQIGILRAYGASRLFVFAIYICEATILWLVAGLIGVLIAFPAGEGIGNHIMQVWHQRGGGASATAGREVAVRFFHAPPEFLAAILGGALLICWVATAWAAIQATRINPAVAVRSRE